MAEYEIMGNIGKKRRRIGRIYPNKEEATQGLKRLKEKMKAERERYGKTSYVNLRIRKRKLPIFIGVL